MNKRLATVKQLKTVWKALQAEAPRKFFFPKRNGMRPLQTLLAGY